MTKQTIHLAIGICAETYRHDEIHSILQQLNDTYRVTLVSEKPDLEKGRWFDHSELETIDLFLFLPLIGSKLSKFANGLADTPDLVVATQLLNRNRPVVIALFTSDALGLNGNNLMKLMVTKNIYFVPFYQDDPIAYPNRLVSNFKRVPDTLRYALRGKQIQPLIMARDRDD